MADRRPTIRPTAAGSIALAAVIGAAISWLALQVVLYTGAALPLPGAGAWASVLLMTAATGWLAWRTRDAARRREAVEVAVSVTRLRIGKAGVLVAAALGGAYLALAAVAFGGWPAPLAQARVFDALATLFVCLLWGISGLALERACRIPGDPDRWGADSR